MEKVINEAIKLWALVVANKKIAIGVVVAVIILINLVN